MCESNEVRGIRLEIKNLNLAEQFSHSLSWFHRCFTPPPVAYSTSVRLLTLQRRPQPDNGDNIFPSQRLPVSALGEGSVPVSSLGFPIPVRQRPSPVEKWVPRLLKGPTCQQSRGISHSQPPYCSPGHNRLHGAQPFVINSVVNFCWGNKSVTHLQLWIRTFLASFFLLLSFSLSFLTHCPWQCWPHQKWSLRQKISFPC